MTEQEIIYHPIGVCSSQIRIIISEEKGVNKEDNIIKEVSFTGGCPGNAIGLSRALEGRGVKSVISMLKDVKCGAKDTSCPAQLSEALEEYLEGRKE